MPKPDPQAWAGGRRVETCNRTFGKMETYGDLPSSHSATLFTWRGVPELA